MFLLGSIVYWQDLLPLNIQFLLLKTCIFYSFLCLHDILHEKNVTTKYLL